MLNKKYNIYFYCWFAIIPLFCVLLDLFMSTASANDGNMTINFDYSIINQLIYFSVWSAIITSIWGWMNVIYSLTNKTGKWFNSKQAFNMIISFNVVVFVMYTATMIIDPSGVVGFNNWYKILKSILEHFITPPLIIIFYFISKSKIIKTKDYVLKNSWYVMIIPAIYLIFILVRCAMLHEYMPNIDDAFTVFPYSQLDPYTSPAYIIVFAFIGLLAVFYGIAVLFNYLYNLAYKKQK